MGLKAAASYGPSNPPLHRTDAEARAQGPRADGAATLPRVGSARAPAARGGRALHCIFVHLNFSFQQLEVVKWDTCIWFQDKPLKVKLKLC